MKHWTKNLLEENGYEIVNAKIVDAKLTIANYCSLTLDMDLRSQGTGVMFGGYVLGKCYAVKPSYEDEDFEGFASGTEAIMRIMTTVGVTKLSDLQEEPVRAAYKNGMCKVIGNFIDDIWFDYESFFEDKNIEEDSTKSSNQLEENIKDYIEVFSAMGDLYRTDASGVVNILNDILDEKDINESETIVADEAIQVLLSMIKDATLQEKRALYRGVNALLKLEKEESILSILEQKIGECEGGSIDD